SITPALVYLVAGWVIRGHVGAINSGDLVSFTTLQSRLFFPIGSMLQVSSDVQTSMALFDRIFEYLDMHHEIADAPDAVDLPVDRVRGRVEFSDVWFRYDLPVEETTPSEISDDGHARHSREWALEGVSLEIEPGQLAALVGPSGAGKTTMTYLVPRFYDVQRGAVLIDGIDVRKLRLESLGGLIGIVTQETYLFHTTVRRNLLYGKPDASQEELEGAARAAFIHDRIMELPEGYDTVVGERGYKLSGGEKQRLAIAIAHWLSTILSADVIFVVDRGRVVERGTHGELVARGGLYARLYEQQFRSGAVEAVTEDGLVLASGEVVRRATAPDEL